MKNSTFTKPSLSILKRLSFFLIIFALTISALSAQIDCSSIPAWDQNKVYASGGTRVKYENKVYENRWWTQGDNPAQSGEWGVWKFIDNCTTTNLPTCNLTAPTNGSTFAVNTPVTLSAIATDPNGTITKVEFFANNTSLGVDLTSEYKITWTPTIAGNYTITAKATNNSNISATSLPVNITITGNGNIPPTVRISSPTAGTNFSEGVASISITAIAGDEDGTVASVKFYNGSTLLNTDTSSPYTATINRPANGTYVLTAVATDDDNATTTSASVSVSVGPVNNNKQVIGYITQWDAWKTTTAGVPSAGAYTHLNVDMSKYTILNFSFFGVASDGSLHSGDFRNKEIYQPGTTQAPADLINTDTYSSWDVFILFGETEQVQYINADIVTRATAQGFEVSENSSTWSHPGWRATNKPLPLPLHTESGAPGLLEKAHAAGTKVMASIGGWSMCRHFPEMAADPAKRLRFINDCKLLINLGFDGIDLDWEYPGPFSGMNFTGTEADYTNFAILIEEIRAAIGPDKLITAAMSAAPNKLQGFDWPRLLNTMNYFNMMTYDFNGGWSDIAGHNSPLYPYAGAEADFSWQRTLETLDQLGVPRNKINMGIPFYGRGVICSGSAGLNAATVKRNETVQPDGPIVTCADYTNWPKDVNDGTPNYTFVKQKTGLGTTNGWTRHWDDEAKVPYLTNGSFFLSYDDLESVEYKSQYIVNNQLAGTIVWTVYGDLEFGGTVTNHGVKLKSWSNMSHELIDKVNQVFGNNNINQPPTANITSPAQGASFTQGANITLSASANDTDGTVTKVEFYVNGVLVGVDNTIPYGFVWQNVAAGNYSLTAKATDNKNAVGTSPAVSISVETETPVLTSITVSPSTATIGLNQTQQFTAQAKDQNGNNMTVAITWSANNGTISTSGLYTGTSVGNFRVTAASGPVSGSATVTVTNTTPVLTSITVSPATANIELNSTQQYSAQGYDQNGNTMNVSVTWSATGGRISTSGLYTATEAGSFTISATSGTVIGNANITIASGGDCEAPAYIENGGYTGGSRVENNEIEYECKPYPYSGWCNGAAWAYAPGVGSYWENAWIKIGPCTSSSRSTAEPEFSPPSFVQEANPYPNPFNTITKFNLYLTEDSYVEIKLYNIAGIEVRSLLNKDLTKGQHEVQLDGSGLPTGLYIFKVQLNNKILTGNLIKN